MHTPLRLEPSSSEKAEKEREIISSEVNLQMCGHAFPSETLGIIMSGYCHSNIIHSLILNEWGQNYMYKDAAIFFWPTKVLSLTFGGGGAFAPVEIILCLPENSSKIDMIGICQAGVCLLGIGHFSDPAYDQSAPRIWNEKKTTSLAAEAVRR